ncbi:MAG: endonuclease/exonuclease/phosphatase family metal-dependent hydrolase [Flavobacteriales bacterium]|jgi:endonuclease/exonuclease/phosphatase family metal-dependent hydrolase
MIKKIIKTLLTLALPFGLYVGGVLLWGTIFNYTPKEFTPLSSFGIGHETPDSTFTFVTWNIGFTGLGEETDFFYDGGKTVTQTPQLVMKNRNGIRDFIAAQTDVDYFLLQEVDSCAKRSHHINQMQFISEVLPNYSWSFGKNYDVDFVPMPLSEPMGAVVSGLCTYSHFDTKDHLRTGFDSQFSWPTSIFFLDRCFISERVDLQNGKQLVSINTHCSAYDTAGTMVAQEVKKIMDFAEKEYLKGNYVVIGGDWNQCPPNYSPQDKTGAYNEYILSPDQLPQGFSWNADATTPTNRKLNTVYNANSYTSVIDHFVVSANLEVEEVKVIDLHFKYSDHQPVMIKVRLAD